MSTLSSVFDVVRGWAPHEKQAIEEDFQQHSSVPAGNPLVEGDVCFQQTDGLLARATGGDYGAAASVAALATLITEAPHWWLVVSGATADNYDGLQQGDTGSGFGYVPWKVVAIRGTYMFETGNFTTRAYTPAQHVTAVAGVVDRIPTDNAGLRQLGEVRAYDSANGVLTVTV
jgi:hypothetical protein